MLLSCSSKIWEMHNICLKAFHSEIVRIFMRMDGLKNGGRGNIFPKNYLKK